MQSVQVLWRRPFVWIPRLQSETMLEVPSVQVPVEVPLEVPVEVAQGQQWERGEAPRTAEPG